MGDQDHCTTRKEILRMDRRIHLGLTLNLPTNVDLQTRIRRIRPWNWTQKMLLNYFSVFEYMPTKEIEITSPNLSFYLTNQIKSSFVSCSPINDDYFLSKRFLCF